MPDSPSPSLFSVCGSELTSSLLRAAHSVPRTLIIRARTQWSYEELFIIFFPHIVTAQSENKLIILRALHLFSFERVGCPLAMMQIMCIKSH